MHTTYMCVIYNCMCDYMNIYICAYMRECIHYDVYIMMYTL